MLIILKLVQSNDPFTPQVSSGFSFRKKKKKGGTCSSAARTGCSESFYVSKVIIFLFCYCAFDKGPGASKAN